MTASTSRAALCLVIASLCLCCFLRSAGASCSSNRAFSSKGRSSTWGVANTQFDWNIHQQRDVMSPRLHSISRAEVMDRTKEWADKKIPYCQCNGPAECCGRCEFCDSYRCDCSGYVSYAWKLSHGYTTWTLPEVAHKIAKDDLRHGDVMLDVHEHVVLFDGWTDDKKTHYWCYQEPGCHTEGPHYAFRSAVPYPFTFGTFEPYRYNAIVD